MVAAGLALGDQLEDLRLEETQKRFEAIRAETLLLRFALRMAAVTESAS